MDKIGPIHERAIAAHNAIQERIEAEEAQRRALQIAHHAGSWPRAQRVKGLNELAPR